MLSPSLFSRLSPAQEEGLSNEYVPDDRSKGHLNYGICRFTKMNLVLKHERHKNPEFVVIIDKAKMRTVPAAPAERVSVRRRRRRAHEVAQGERVVVPLRVCRRLRPLVGDFGAVEWRRRGQRRGKRWLEVQILVKSERASVIGSDKCRPLAKCQI